MTTATADDAVLPYREPGIVAILVLVSFVLLLNVASHFMDKILYCGLLAQIFVGIAWGPPGGDWLGRDLEHAVVDMGYLGLLLVVYEGGLLTSFKALKDNLPLSTGVAATGIVLPIASSYFLPLLVGATPLQAFAAGAALCSTSLGTIFSLLSASNLSTTRLGIVLTSAAMMDDIVGLVMVRVISNLGTSSTAFTATDVIRPALVSIAFVVVFPLAARLGAYPLTIYLNRSRVASPGGGIDKIMSLPVLPLAIHTILLVALVTTAVYAGTSGLFAAYLTGASITWWDTEAPHAATRPTAGPQQLAPAQPRDGTNQERAGRTGAETFKDNYAQPLRRVLKPFFFASIGFSIPISRMFAATIVWKGIIYALLMFVAKFICGFWLMRIPGLATRTSVRRPGSKPSVLNTSEKLQPPATCNVPEPMSNGTMPPSPAIAEPAQAIVKDAPLRSNEPQRITPCVKQNSGSAKQPSTDTTPKPISLYPGCIFGCAMVARGEIGFLISAIAESKSIYGDEPNGPIFLVVTWAIVLCTIVGPILVGILVKRIKHLERRSSDGAPGVLGVWGVG